LRCATKNCLPTLPCLPTHSDVALEWWLNVASKLKEGGWSHGPWRIWKERKLWRWSRDMDKGLERESNIRNQSCRIEGLAVTRQVQSLPRYWLQVRYPQQSRLLENGSLSISISPIGLSMVRPSFFPRYSLLAFKSFCAREKSQYHQNLFNLLIHYIKHFDRSLGKRNG
jgi:hypothetical protein